MPTNGFPLGCALPVTFYVLSVWLAFFALASVRGWSGPRSPCGAPCPRSTGLGDYLRRYQFPQWPARLDPGRSAPTDGQHDWTQGAHLPQMASSTGPRARRVRQEFQDAFCGDVDGSVLGHGTRKKATSQGHIRHASPDFGGVSFCRFGSIRGTSQASCCCCRSAGRAACAPSDNGVFVHCCQFQ